jgi:hypothetical protein
VRTDKRQAGLATARTGHVPCDRPTARPIAGWNGFHLAPRTEQAMAKKISNNPDVPPADVGDETGDASSPRPDENVVSEIGEEVGMTFEDNEPLRPIEKVGARDQDRWELNPASSSDYRQRQGEAGAERPADEDELSDEDLEDMDDDDEDLDEDDDLSDDDVELDEDDIESDEDDLEAGEELGEGDENP